MYRCFTVLTCFNLVWWFPHFSSVFFHLAIAILSGSTGQELSSSSSALLAEIRQVFLANQSGSQRGRTQPPNNGWTTVTRCGEGIGWVIFRSISQFTIYVHYVNNNWIKYMIYIYEKSILQWCFAPTKRDLGAPLRYQVETILMGSKVGDLGISRWFHEHVYQCFLVDLVKCDPPFF